jgi:hypothetical protein
MVRVIYGNVFINQKKEEVVLGERESKKSKIIS